MEKKFVRDKPVPGYKKKIVEDFKERIENNRTVLVASCKGLPGQQFNEIKKKLRGKVDIKFARKSAIERAIDGINKGALKNLKEILTADFAIIFSDMDAFELSGLLTDNESASKAKVGDISPEDIEIEPGLTNLPAGPAISELQSVGLKVKVTDGKLEIIKGAIVVRKGEKIDNKVVGVLAKLDIAPMKVGFIPLAAYDSQDDKVYKDIVIDKEGTLETIKTLIGKALGFAINIGYPNEKTIIHFIAKANVEEKALSSLVKEEKVEEKEESKEVKEQEKEETSGNPENNVNKDVKEEQV
jgi:large subunit ribosomal protein L10